MKNSANILSEKDLDALLAGSFLNLDFNKAENVRMLESVADSYIGSRVTLSAPKGSSLLGKIIVVFFSLGILTAGFYFFNKNNGEEKGKMPVNTKTEEKKDELRDTVKEQEVILQEQKIGKPFVDKERQLPEITEPQLTQEPVVIEPEEEIVHTEVVIPRNKVTAKDEYIFPKLTEKEIKANEREKKRMAKMASKMTREKYWPIPGKKFYMQTAEVTNLEYRTFLFDLLINDKKEEFLKAKPDQKLWINSNGTSKFDNYKDLYFSDKRFKDNPVVNITVEGAEMYCKWLSDIASSYLKHESTRLSSCNYRLPTESEWVYAAKAGRPDATYPWGRDSIQNNKNRFLANFCVQKMKEKFNQPIVYPFPINPNAYTAGGMALNKDSVATVLVYAYNPNDYYLYCMSGNVSEMVYADDNKKPKTKGGNWSSDFMHLKIDSEDEFKAVKPSPMIGFRVVVDMEN